MTSYSENAGLTIMTGVVNRNVAGVGAVIMLLCGLFPSAGQFVKTIPAPAIGGILLIVVRQIVVSGFQMISETGFSARNRLIVVLSRAFGIGFMTSMEAGIWSIFRNGIQAIFPQNPVAIIFVIALILNLILPKNMEE